MLKTILIASMAIFLLFGCEATDEEGTIETFTFSSDNVKTGPANYFSFATNTADTAGTSNWDVKFATFSFSIPINDSTFMTISNPFIEGATDIMVARVDAASLEEVTEVPASFSDSTYSTMATEDIWYTTTDAHVVQPLDYVYVLNTADGKYPAFEITNYYDDLGESGVYTIAWKYLSE